LDIVHKGGIKVLKGKLVLLRPVQRADITYFLKWFNDPEVIQYLGMYLPMTEMAEQKFIEDLGSSRATTDAFFVIEALESEISKPIGSISLNRINNKDHNAVFGIAIGDKQYWSKGYGTDIMNVLLRYAFTELNLKRVSLTVFEYNPRAIRSYEKAGFRHEGHLRSILNREGRRWNEVYMGILREEWLGLNS